MAQVTTRYEAQEWEPLLEGWRIARGRDVRLERTVILAAVSKGGMSSARMDAWMARRSALVHDRVAVLLDFAETPEAYVAVFEGTGVSIGLPASADTRLIGACMEIVDGVQALFAARVPFAFTGGQILWERGAPLVMGLPHGRAEQGVLSESEYVREMSRYFGNVMEWQYVARRDNPGSGAIWEQAMRRLKGVDGRGPETFVSLQTILRALLVDAEMEPIPVGPPAQSAPSVASVRDLEADGTRPHVLPDGAAKVMAYRVADREPRLARGAGLESAVSRAEEPPVIPGFSQSAARPRVRRAVLWIAGLVVAVLAAAAYIWHGARGTNSLSAGSQPSVRGGQGSGEKQGSSSGSGTGGSSSQGTGEKPAAAGGSVGSPSGGASSAKAGTTAAYTPGSAAPLKSVVGRSPAAGVALLVGHGVSPSAIGWRTMTGASGDIVAAARSGSRVILTVAVPKGEELVPNLAGLTVSQAGSVLLSADFHYSYVLKSHPRGTAGRVYAQNPGAFTLAARGTNVSFEVAAHY